MRTLLASLLLLLLLQALQALLELLGAALRGGQALVGVQTHLRRQGGSRWQSVVQAAGAFSSVRAPPWRVAGVPAISQHSPPTPALTSPRRSASCSPPASRACACHCSCHAAAPAGSACTRACHGASA